MLELRFVRENLDLVRHKCHLRGVDPQLIDQFTATDSRRLAVLAEVERLSGAEWGLVAAEASSASRG